MKVTTSAELAKSMHIPDRLLEDIVLKYKQDCKPHFKWNTEHGGWDLCCFGLDCRKTRC